MSTFITYPTYEGITSVESRGRGANSISSNLNDNLWMLDVSFVEMNSTWIRQWLYLISFRRYDIYIYIELLLFVNNGKRFPKANAYIIRVMIKLFFVKNGLKKWSFTNFSYQKPRTLWSARFFLLFWNFLLSFNTAQESATQVLHSQEVMPINCT